MSDFTQATRCRPGTLWFEWSPSVETDNQFLLVEAFTDAAAAAHVASAHFTEGLDAMRPMLARTPRS